MELSRMSLAAAAAFPLGPLFIVVNSREFTALAHISFTE